jgi:hypothetical protein
MCWAKKSNGQILSRFETLGEKVWHLGFLQSCKIKDWTGKNAFVGGTFYKVSMKKHP